MPQLVVEMSSEEERLYRGIQRIVAAERGIDVGFKKAKRSAKEMEDQAVRSSKRTTSSLQDSIASLKRLSLAYTAVRSVMDGLNKTKEEDIRLSQKSLDLERQLAIAQNTAVKNLAGLPTGEKQDILSRVIPAIQARTGFGSQASLTNAFSAGFSSSGSVSRTKSAVEAAARVTLLSSNEVGTVTSGALDAAKATGLDDARRNIGLLLSVGKEARVEDPAKLSRNLAPALISGVATVPDQNKVEASREIGAAFATLTQRGGDVTGESSSTATIQLASRVAEFFTQESTGEKGRREKGKLTDLDKKLAAARAGDPGTFRGRLDSLAGDETLREQFLANPFGEARFRKTIEQLITNGSAARQQFETALKGITPSAELFERVAKEGATATPEVRRAVAEIKAEATLELARSQKKAQDGLNRKLLEQALERTETALPANRRIPRNIVKSIPIVSDMLISDELDQFDSAVTLGNDSNEVAQRKIRDRIGLIAGKRFPTQDQVDALPGERRTAVTLLQDILEQIRDVNQETLDELKSQNEGQQTGDILPAMRQQQAVPTE